MNPEFDKLVGLNTIIEAFTDKLEEVEAQANERLMDLEQDDAFCVRMLDIVEASIAGMINNDEYAIYMMDAKKVYAKTQSYKTKSIKHILNEVFKD